MTSKAQRFPTTGGQRRLWGLTRANPGEWQDNLNAVHLIEGPVDSELLGRAVHVVRFRHGAMRTSIRNVGRSLTQVIHPVRYRRLRTVDPEQVLQDGLTAWLVSRMETPFFLSSGPLWSFDLLRVTLQRHLFVIRSHHIVSDGISMETVWREVADAYSQLVEGKVPMESMVKSFGHYAEWLQSWTSDSRHTNRYLQYWSGVLAGKPWPRLYWRDGRTATAFRGRAWRGRLPPECKPAIEAARERWLVTDYVVALAAYLTTVYVHTGETDLGLISPFAGRQAPGLHSVVGRLMTGHVIRYQFDPCLTAGGLLRSLGKQVAQVLAHHDVPLEWLIERFGLTPRQPMDQIRFSLEDFSTTNHSLGGIPTRAYEYGSHTGPHRDLSLYVRVHADRWNLVVQFNEFVLDPSVVERLMRTYVSALVACADTRDLSIVESTRASEAAMASSVDWKDHEGIFVDMLSFGRLAARR